MVPLGNASASLAHCVQSCNLCFRANSSCLVLQAVGGQMNGWLKGEKHAVLYGEINLAG